LCRSLGQVNLLFAVFERRVLGLRVREKLHSALHLLFPRHRVILASPGRCCSRLCGHYTAATNYSINVHIARFVLQVGKGRDLGEEAMFGLLFRTMLTWASASDEVATLEPHTISAATDASFCDLCVNRLPEGVSGCRAEFYTNERLKKCGVIVGEQ